MDLAGEWRHSYRGDTRLKIKSWRDEVVLVMLVWLYDVLERSHKQTILVFSLLVS